MPLKSVSDILAGHIADRGWTLAELGRRTALDHTLLSRLLRGERNWRFDHLDAVARALELDLDKLLKGTDQEHHLTAKEYAQSYGELDAEAMGAKLADALAQNRASDAAVRALEEELRQRPTREQYTSLVEQLRTSERERQALAKQLTALTAESNEWMTQAIVSQASVEALKQAAADATKQAETFRKAAVKWMAEAKKLGSKADVATITALTAFGFASIAGGREPAARRRKSS